MTEDYESAYWETYLHTTPSYSSVEILEVGQGNCLTYDEVVVLHGEIEKPTPPYSNWHLYKNQSKQRETQQHKKWDLDDHVVGIFSGKVLNPIDGSVVRCSGTFTLGMFSKIHSNDLQSWVLFDSRNVEIHSYDQRQNHSSDGNKVTYEKFKISLKDNASQGFVQFFQSAKNGAIYCPRKYEHPYGSLLTLYVLSPSVGNRIYPPILPVRFESKQIFVPLFPNQTMQVVVPKNYAIESPDKNFSQSIIRDHHSESYNGNYTLEYFHCKRNNSNVYPVFFNAYDTDNQGVIISPPIEHIDGKAYAVIHSPSEDMVLFNNGIDGVIFRTSEPMHHKRTGCYLDKNFRFYIESSGQLSTGKYNAFDLRLSIKEKSKDTFRFKNINDPNTCQAI